MPFYYFCSPCGKEGGETENTDRRGALTVALIEPNRSQTKEKAPEDYFRGYANSRCGKVFNRYRSALLLADFVLSR
jgi:hypothetical protein